MRTWFTSMHAPRYLHQKHVRIHRSTSWIDTYAGQYEKDLHKLAKSRKRKVGASPTNVRTYILVTEASDHHQQREPSESRMVGQSPSPPCFIDLLEEKEKHHASTSHLSDAPEETKCTEKGYTADLHFKSELFANNSTDPSPFVLLQASTQLMSHYQLMQPHTACF